MVKGCLLGGGLGMAVALFLAWSPLFVTLSGIAGLAFGYLFYDIRQFGRVVYEVVFLQGYQTLQHAWNASSSFLRQPHPSLYLAVLVVAVLTVKYVLPLLRSMVNFLYIAPETSFWHYESGMEHTISMALTTGGVGWVLMSLVGIVMYYLVAPIIILGALGLVVMAVVAIQEIVMNELALLNASQKGVFWVSPYAERRAERVKKLTATGLREVPITYRRVYSCLGMQLLRVLWCLMLALWWMIKTPLVLLARLFTQFLRPFAFCGRVGMRVLREIARGVHSRERTVCAISCALGCLISAQILFPVISSTGMKGAAVLCAGVISAAIGKTVSSAARWAVARTET